MLSDNSGVGFLPAKLFVILAIAALLLVLLVSGMADLSGVHSRYLARGETDRIYEFARLEYAGGCAGGGTGRPILVSIPASVRTIAYGAAPVNGTPVRMDRTYYVEYSDGRCETFVADIPFACDLPDGPADIPLLLHPGKYRINARPACLNGSYKACIRAEAA